MFVHNALQPRRTSTTDQSPHEETDLAASSRCCAGQAGPFRPRDRPGLGMLSPRRSGRVGRYNQGGLAALQERPHTRCLPRLAAADVPRFRDRLEAGPTPQDGVCTFRCQDLLPILEEEFGVKLVPAGRAR